ncbi:DUF3836 domain-containing protein [Bacteroides thetaiotaomicron]|uniref:DUF3836 domain-containing protein n=1 Tax=Bacteroides thetaiotaomicron TaxID=818 RepID=UPI001F2EAACF|nr:DUF3836 domain-containing protein [Bacteroides thetaiotaomicron]MCE8951681.1 DUF3836 domain-containing protein [Bacteroides thetaiotaomicron]MCE8968898.1 DUF3836 domain-containing protein [Bacteroides thetaiotaomicron]
MKTLIVSILLAVSSFTSNAVADNSNLISRFAYDYEMNDSQMTSKIVYKVEDQKFLHPYLKYCYSYDSTGRVSQKDVLKWNQETEKFEKQHCLRFAYNDTDVTVELISWNAKQQTYSTVKEKSVYQLSDNNTIANYLNYEWNERDNNWNLVIQHNTVYDENEYLLSEK